MSRSFLPRLPHVALTLLALATVVSAAQAQPRPASPTAAAQLHANAVASFRQGRFAEAFGRFNSLADAGHAPSAAIALWMFQNGPAVFGSDWDSSQDQLTAWAQLAGQPVPQLVGHVYATRTALHTRKAP
jgi:hypothetical protein